MADISNDLEKQLLSLEDFYQKDKFHIDVKNAYPGMVLKESIYNNGSLILAEGAILTDTIISALKRRGIQEIVVDTKDEILASLDGIVNSTIDVKTLNQMKSMLRKVQTLDDQTIKSLVDAAKLLVHKVLEAENFTYSMSDYLDDIEKDLASHSVRTCVYALVLAKAFNKKLSKPLLNYEDIATAAMFHDIGSSCKSQEVRSQICFIKGFGRVNSFLTDEKVVQASKVYNSIYDTYYAYCILNSQSEVSATAKAMVFFSRENRKGTGPYKYSKMGDGKDDIRSMSASRVGAEIINLCSTFDQEICNCLEKSKTLENVQVFIQSLGMTKTFHQELLDLLVENIPLYPIGTRVKLGDGINSYGIVVQNHKNLQYYHLPQILKIPEREVMDLRYSITPIISEICGKETRLSDLYISTESLEENAPRR